MPRLLRLLALCASLLAPFAAAQDKPDPNQQVIAEVTGLLKQRPDDPTLHYYLAMFQARTQQAAAAAATLHKVAELGKGFYPVEEFGFGTIATDARYQAARDALGKLLPRIDGAPVAFRLADKRMIPEGIAFDPQEQYFYIGSLSGRGIVRVSMAGKQEPFSRNGDGLKQILGIAIDPQRRALYAVSNSVPDKMGKRISTVVRYDLATGKYTGKYRAPKARMLNDIAIAPNGDLYVSDTEGGTVWHLPAGAAKFKAIVPAGTLEGANGIAMTGDGSTLYLAHSMGIAKIDVASAKVSQLALPARETAGAIDGLYLHQGDLIGIQNVTNPGRVVRLKLKDNGSAVAAVDTLQSHHNPAFVQPTTGAIAGDALYVLGTTQISQYEDGKIKHEAGLLQPAVVRVPLSTPVR